VNLQTLHVASFRNLTDQSVDFGSGFNYLHGANGAGKTAILEAIHLLARGRSFRTSRASTMIQTDHPLLVVRGEVALESGQHQVMAMSKSRSGKTELKLNGVAEARASRLAKLLPVQTLLPDAAELVLGGPGRRRAFLDWGVFHVEPRFVDNARNYRRVLLQRNAWLKSLAGEDVGVGKDPWFEQLCTLGSALSEQRQAYLGELQSLFQNTLRKLSPAMTVRLEYEWGGLQGLSVAEKKLSESWPRDVKFGMTHRGPHRADLLFMTADQVAAETASRGQAKLISSAAILAQAELLYTHSNAKSLFLIDDFGAELDAEHWHHFLSTLLELECQVIATSTDPLDESQQWVKGLSSLQVFHVEHGNIARAH